jgi:hypothetical protein
VDTCTPVFAELAQKLPIAVILGQLNIWKTISGLMDLKDVLFPATKVTHIN